jgi:hypothetical protein
MLKAIVVITAFIAGERATFQPGDEVPEDALAKHDRAALLKSGAIVDTKAEEAKAKASADLAKDAGKEFDRARQAAKDAAASVVSDQETGDSKVSAPAARKKN